jgi:hypothetical protein
MWEFEDFTEVVEDDDPEVVAALERLQVMRTVESKVLDLDAYRLEAKRRTTPFA